MNTQKPNDDKRLDALLHSWKMEPSLPPRFGEQVWRRIERVETVSVPKISLVTLVANWVATRLPRPAFAMAYVTLLLAIGASVGWRQARQESTRITGDLSARYVQAVDPYQATR